MTQITDDTEMSGIQLLFQIVDFGSHGKVHTDSIEGESDEKRKGKYQWTQLRMYTAATSKASNVCNITDCLSFSFSFSFHQIPLQ